MKIKTSQKSFISLESVAMTDIVMNLFIFFFISFSLLYTFNNTKESKIEVKLPQGVTKSEGKGDNSSLTVTISSTNEIYLDGSKVTLPKLKSLLIEKTSKRKDLSLIVQSDKRASVDHLVKVLDTAKQAGMQKLGVAIEQA